MGRNVFDFRQEIIRADHYFGQKVQLTGRYTTDSIPTQEPGALFTGSSLPGVANTTTNSPGHNPVIRATATLTPNLANEAGYGYSYVRYPVLGSRHALVQIRRYMFYV